MCFVEKMECESLGQEGLPYRISVRGSFRLGAEVKHPWLDLHFSWALLPKTMLFLDHLCV